MQTITALPGVMLNMVVINGHAPLKKN